MRLEVQLVLQTRHDESKTILPPRAAQAILWLGSLGVESLMARDMASWIGERRAVGTNQDFRRFVVYALQVLHAFRKDAEGVSEWDRDVWRITRLGLDPHRVARTRVRTISFAGIEPEWLRTAYKRWSKWRLQLGSASPTTVDQTVKAIRFFSAFLKVERIELPTSEALTREHLERYLAHVNASKYSIPYKHQQISTVRHFLDEIAALGWLTLDRNARYYRREIPQKRGSKPRFIDDHVMCQLETEEALLQIPDMTSRSIIMVVMETGLRGIDARFLPLDPVHRGNDGQPYLRFLNHKANREAVIPISDRLAAQIAAQQTHVRESYAPTCEWLFPALQNRSGEQACGPGLINATLGRWLEQLQLTDQLGNPVTATAHQFRHTVATRMINDKVSLVAVQRFLDHTSSEMTMVYAKMHDTTLREEVAPYHQRINRKGELVPQETGPLADAAWMKDHLARAKQALPNGYCGRPLVQQCPHPNACLTCSHFLTDASFLPLHRTHLTQLEEMIAKAETNGWERLVESNNQDRASLLDIIDGLQALEHQGETRAA